MLPISLSSLQILLVQISGSWKDQWTLEKLMLPGNILLVSINLSVTGLLGTGFFNNFLSSSKMKPWGLLKISSAERTVNVKYVYLVLFSQNKLVVGVYEYGILEVYLSTWVFFTFLVISGLLCFSCFLGMLELQCPSSLGTLEFLAKIKLKYKCKILE